MVVNEKFSFKFSLTKLTLVFILIEFLPNKLVLCNFCVWVFGVWVVSITYHCKKKMDWWIEINAVNLKKKKKRERKPP